MGIDSPEDDDVPLAVPRLGEVDSGDVGSQFAEYASRHEYYAEHRAKVEAVYLADARQRWEEAKPGFEGEWRQYKEDHPAPAHVRPGIDPEARAQIEGGCKEIRETEENIVTPVMARIEGEDPERLLVGLEFRRKGQDRIMEKAAEALDEQPDLTPSEALASVKDAIRYTFQYSEHHYTEGVYADCDRLKAAGFELVELRNSWRSEEYKGINSRWRVSDVGQLFEVQFHTAISFEAKQLTHQAYERIRNPATPDGEVRELRAFQRKVNTKVPHPPGAMNVPEHP